MDVRRVPAVVRGSGHHRLVLVAAGLAVLLAATVLAALAALTEKAVEGGVQRRPAADPAAVVEVSGGYRAAGGRELDRDVRAALDRTYAGVAHHTWSALRAPSARSTELPVVEAAGRPRSDATVAVGALEGAGQHAELVSGRWPHGGDDPETALNEVLASGLGVRAGDSLTVRTADKKRLRLRVCGLYRTGDRSPALWASVASAFGTPDTIALVPRRVITDSAGLSRDASELWLGVPDAGRLRIDDIGPLARRAERFSGSDVSLSVYRGRTPTTRLGVVPGLENALDELGTSVAVARAGLYVPATLLAALAATALVLTARQLAEHRRPELAVHAARGAGTPRIAAATAALWASVALPAGLAAPFLAGPRCGSSAGPDSSPEAYPSRPRPPRAGPRSRTAATGAPPSCPVVSSSASRSRWRRRTRRVSCWPTSPASGENVFAALRRANEELGATVLVVTHDPLVSGQVRRTVRIRDGRTSTETLRERGEEGEEFTVLDRAGQLQLPRDHVERYGLRGRVRLTGEAGHVGVWPDRDDRSDG